MRHLRLPLLALVLAGCSGAEGDATAASMQDNSAAASTAQGGKPFQVEVVADFDAPWAMTFLPGGERALITEKEGRLLLWSRASTGEPAPATANAVTEVAGVPKVAFGGQGGLGDVVLHPDFANNGLVYLSYAEAGQGGAGAAVGRGRLVMEGTLRLENFQVIWRQEPKVSGGGHYGHRLAFSPDGYLFISSGDRQKFDPAQADDQNLGKIIRLTDTGGIPSDNPFYDQGRVKAQIWTKGHRNPLGIAFDAEGRLWEHEMGPKGGDELNLIVKGRNYGYPIVSDGDHYDGKPIPDHATRPEFEAPKLTWTPVISPAGLIIYSGDMFPAWKGSALIGAMNKPGLVRVALNGDKASKADVWDLDGQRIREVEQGPDGAVWLLEDGGRGSQGRLLKLTPAR
jgi:aldose sugar dehydrogenase